jgi:quinoprotein glucose dehydrogenase
MNDPNPNTETTLSRWTCRAYSALLMVIGAALATGGVTLLTYGGSIYYLVAGGAIGLGGLWIWRKDRRGIQLYGGTLIFTVAWAIWEIGFDGWGLFARLAALVVLGLPILLRPVRSIGRPAAQRARWRGWPAFAGGILLAILAGAAIHSVGTEKVIDPLLQRGKSRIRNSKRRMRPVAIVTS